MRANAPLIFDEPPQIIVPFRSGGFQFEGRPSLPRHPCRANLHEVRAFVRHVHPSTRRGVKRLQAKAHEHRALGIGVAWHRTTDPDQIRRAHHAALVHGRPQLRCPGRTYAGCRRPSRPMSTFVRHPFGRDSGARPLATCRPRPEATTPTIERPPLLIGVRATMLNALSRQQSTKHSPRGPAADVAAFDRHAKEGIALKTRFRDANRIAAGRGGVPARRRGPRNTDHGK
jgi:hypothetical protein